MEKQFAKGVNVKTIQTKYGEIIKVGINTEKIFENNISENGWVNFDIKKSKTGTLYAEI
jgi:hypothetical protein